MRFLFAIAVLLLAGCSQSERVVVVYSSQDQVYAEPLFARFEKETGFKVLPVFDSESAKTRSLAQRLISEKENPRADIFWSNEELVFRQLVKGGLVDPTSNTKVGSRERRLIINTNFVRLNEAPKDLADLTNSKWSGRVALAYPLYGTTAAHVVALRKFWGDAKWKNWCESLEANKPFVVDGNSFVVRLVAAGEAWIGLTDSDDFAAGLRNNSPIACVPLNSADELPSISNCVGIVTGSPHRSEAAAFLEFAKSEKTVSELIQVKALESRKCTGETISDASYISETLRTAKDIFVRK